MSWCERTVGESSFDSLSAWVHPMAISVAAAAASCVRVARMSANPQSDAVAKLAAREGLERIVDRQPIHREAGAGRDGLLPGQRPTRPRANRDVVAAEPTGVHFDAAGGRHGR